MVNAVLSLVGSIVGVAVTALIAYYSFRRDREKQEQQFAQERSKLERQLAEERRQQEREFASEWAKVDRLARQERETLRNAIEAELRRVQGVIKRQRGYVWDDQTNKVHAEFERHPLNWAPVHTPIWDSTVSQGKVGLLPAEDAERLTWFFGYVRWMNQDLLSLYGFYKAENRVPEFAKHVAVAYDTLLRGQYGFAGDSTPERTATT